MTVSTQGWAQYLHLKFSNPPRPPRVKKQFLPWRPSMSQSQTSNSVHPHKVRDRRAGQGADHISGKELDGLLGERSRNREDGAQRTQQIALGARGEGGAAWCRIRREIFFCRHRHYGEFRREFYSCTVYCSDSLI